MADDVVTSIAASDQFLAVATKGRVQLLRLGVWTKGDVLTCVDTGAALTALCFSADGKRLAAGSENGCVTVWHIESLEREFEQSGHSNWISAVSFNPNGDVLASGGTDGVVRLWNLESDEALPKIKASPEAIIAVAFSPGNGEILATGGYDDVIKLWRGWRLPRDEPDATLVGHSDGIRSIVIPSEYENTLISASDDCTLKVWDMARARERVTLKGHLSAVRCAIQSSNGQLLISGSRDGTIRLWEAASKSEVRASGYYAE